MARRSTTAQNPLAGLLALAEALGGVQTPQAKKREFTGAREGYRAVAVISVEEAKAIVKAASTGKEQKVTVNGRESVIEVLDTESATKFKGGFRLHRHIGQK